MGQIRQERLFFFDVPIPTEIGQRWLRLRQRVEAGYPELQREWVLEDVSNPSSIPHLISVDRLRSLWAALGEFLAVLDAEIANREAEPGASP